MTDFARFWMDGVVPGEDDDPGEDLPVGPAPPGVSPEEIAAWEGRYGVTLPEPIRTALTLRNGGRVRNADVEIAPLDEIAPVDDDFWEYEEIDPDEAPDHALVFAFGDDTRCGGRFLMNFNENGPGGPPSLYVFFNDGCGATRLDDDLGDFFERLLASDDAPGVDWSESDRLPAVARETVGRSAFYGGTRATREQVLAREGEALILFTRERTPRGEVLSRTTLPLPLDAGSATVAPLRTALPATFALHLQPGGAGGIVQVRSETTDDGRWKTTTARGAPSHVSFESADRGRLDALQAQLIGAGAAARVKAGQDRRAGSRTALDALPPDERRAALAEVARKAVENLDRQAATLGPVPPQLAPLAAQLRQKLAEALGRAAGPLPDPETFRRIEDALLDRGGGGPPTDGTLDD